MKSKQVTAKRCFHGAGKGMSMGKAGVGVKEMSCFYFIYFFSNALVLLRSELDLISLQGKSDCSDVFLTPH